MKKNTRIIAAVLAMCMLFSTVAFAAETETASGPAVRVNGKMVEFPDAQPYIDENNRTMLPVRFVVEALGAEAEWDGANRTAIITKGDISIAIPIGKTELTVTEDGVSRTVTMDTTAVLREDRTFIPVRFIAESLGAYVDYSNAYRTVGIYQDCLTAEEIETLRSYDYTVPTAASEYNWSKAKRDQAYMDYYYGGAGSATIRETFDNYANAREFLYQAHRYSTIAGDKVFPALGITLTDMIDIEEFYDTVIREAKAEIDYESERMTVQFRTDSSCIYHPDDKSFLETTVRGIIVVKLHVEPTKLSGEEDFALTQFGFFQTYQDIELYVPIDVHMNTAGDTVNVNTYAPLAPVYY